MDGLAAAASSGRNRGRGSSTTNSFTRKLQVLPATVSGGIVAQADSKRERIEIKTIRTGHLPEIGSHDYLDPKIGL
jgi:hypothetical protein